MSTIKVKNEDGSWDFLQLAGEDVTELKEDVSSVKSELAQTSQDIDNKVQDYVRLNNIPNADIGMIDKLSNGHVVWIYNNRMAKSIEKRVSIDEGLTWSEPETVIDTSHPSFNTTRRTDNVDGFSGPSDCTMGIVGDDIIVVVYCVTGGAREGGAWYDFDCIRSLDGGLTWEEPTSEIVIQYVSGGPTGKIVEYNNKLWFAYTDIDGGQVLDGRYYLRVLSSNDYGVTWNTPITIHDEHRDTDTMQSPIANEPCLAVNSKGQMVVVAQSFRVGVLQITSPDGGQTWQKDGVIGQSIIGGAYQNSSWGGGRGHFASPFILALDDGSFEAYLYNRPQNKIIILHANFEDVSGNAYGGWKLRAVIDSGENDPAYGRSVQFGLKRVLVGSNHYFPESPTGAYHFIIYNFSKQTKQTSFYPLINLYPSTSFQYGESNLNIWLKPTLNGFLPSSSIQSFVMQPNSEMEIGAIPYMNLTVKTLTNPNQTQEFRVRTISNPQSDYIDFPILKSTSNNTFSTGWKPIILPKDFISFVAFETTLEAKSTYAYNHIQSIQLTLMFVTK
jgi:hypothetical protein